MLSFNQFSLISESHYGSEEDAKKLIVTLQNNGFIARYCGGFVRDTIVLGVPSKDIDILTNATPDQILKLFKNKATFAGKSFGVVIVTTPSGPVDVATMRKDGQYSDGRHPDSVEFTHDPFEDSKRRDFDFNGLSYDPVKKELFDYHGGVENLKKGIIKTIGNPEERFTEDLLRIFRLVRFSSRFNLTPHDETLAAARKLAPQVAKIAAERIMPEITKSLLANAPKTLDMLQQTNVLKYVFPDLESHFSLTMKLMHNLNAANPSSELALSVLFSQMSVSKVEGLLKRLKLTNDEQNHIVSTLKLQNRMNETPAHATMDVMKRMMRIPQFADALTLYGMRVNVHDPEVSREKYVFLHELYGKMSHGDLNPVKFVTGDDLTNLFNMKPGKEYKVILDTIENMQLRHELKSRKDALEYVKTHFTYPH